MTGEQMVNGSPLLETDQHEPIADSRNTRPRDHIPIDMRQPAWLRRPTVKLLKTKLDHFKSDEIYTGLGCLMAAQTVEPATSATPRQREKA